MKFCKHKWFFDYDIVIGWRTLVFHKCAKCGKVKRVYQNTHFKWGMEVKKLDSIAKMQIVLYGMVERQEVNSKEFEIIHKYLEIAKSELFGIEGGKND